MENLTAKKYFTDEQWEKIPEYERTRMTNKLRNYMKMVRLGFKMSLPDFVVAWGAKAKLPADDGKKPTEIASTSKSPVSTKKSKKRKLKPTASKSNTASKQTVTWNIALLTHSGEKKFSCTDCSYKCNQAGSLTKHVAAKHAG